MHSCGTEEEVWKVVERGFVGRRELLTFWKMKPFHLNSDFSSTRETVAQIGDLAAGVEWAILCSFQATACPK